MLVALVLAAACAPVAARDARALREDVLGATMAGEYALQAGRLDEAVEWYLAAARASGDDAGLAERATRIALLGNDDARTAQALALWRARAPRSLDMQVAEATLAMRTGRLRAARRELRAILRGYPDTGWRHAVLVLGGARDQARAAKLLEQVVDSGDVPDLLPAWLEFASLAQRLDQTGLAGDILLRIMERFPGEPRVALLRSSQARQAGDMAQAAAALAEIGEAARLAPELRYAVAAEYDAIGDPSAAERILASGPQDPHIHALRASLLAKAEDKQALELLYDELRQGAEHPDPGQRLLLGHTAEYLERYGEALEWYASVPAGDQRWQARLRSIIVLHTLGRADETWDALRRLQGDAAASDDMRRTAYLLEAELRAKDRDFDGEHDAYTRGLAAYPDEVAILYSRALMWERRDDIPRAEADLRKILVAEPENVATLNALGYTLADRTDRYEEALELIDRARVAEPDNAAIIDSHGWVLFRLGRNEEALVELRRAYTLQKDAEIAAHVAHVLWVLGRKDEARRYFDEARKLDPENRSLLRALRETGA